MARYGVARSAGGHVIAADDRAATVTVADRAPGRFIDGLRVTPGSSPGDRLVSPGDRPP
jgi:hypothetical protein